MLERWNFVKDQRGSWRWYHVDANATVTNSVRTFPGHDLCVANAKKVRLALVGAVKKAPRSAQPK